MLKSGINERWFGLSEQIQESYKRRDDPEILESIKENCLKMISMSKEMILEFQTYTEMNQEMIEKWETVIKHFSELSNGDDNIARLAKEKIKEAEEYIEKLKKPKLKKVQLPIHIGYEKLFQIFLNEKNYINAIRIAEKARDEGWSGEWIKRIDKTKRKAGNNGI